MTRSPHRALARSLLARICDLVRVDLASAFFRKRADVVVNASKRRRPFERPGGFRT